METVLGAPIHNVPPLRRMSTPKRTSFRARTFCCSGSGAHDDIEMHHQDHLPSINNKVKEKHNDIWKLFREAQENILYLNKQRLLAMEELEKLKRENNSLLQRQLQSKKLNDTRTDKLWISSGLLLRIDSMVLAGMIDSSEASDLRRLIIDHKVSVADDFNDIMEKNDAVLLEELRQFSEISKRKGFHVIHICTEMAPVLCVGSLASYVTGLCCALQRKGNLVEVILPMYASLNLDEVHGLREVEAEFYSYFNGQLHRNKIWTGVVYGIGVTFIQPLDHSSFFSCEKVYGYSNDFERFTYFSRASLDYIVKSGKQPDILHIHNWETSIIGPLFWDVFVNQGLGGTRILLTCQNFESQCLEQPEKLALCGLDPSRLHRSDRLQDNNKAHLVNILKGGIVYSNKVLIMSSILPKGHIIRTMGHGLESTLTIHKDKLLIAPHGIDDSTWDPSQDRSLPQSYNADDMKGKSVCKVSLQQHLGLSENSSMIVVGCIVLDLSNVELENLRALVWMASRWSVQFIFMMFNQSPVISRACQSLQQEVEGENVRFVNNYDDVLAHLLIAGSDIMLCLSYDDPVLQLPLKAMKYGAAPLAIHLADSRFRHFVDHDFESTKLSQYINNTFANMSLSVAIDEIKNNPSQWNRRIKDAMTKNFSWEAECCDIHLSAYTAIKNL